MESEKQYRLVTRSDMDGLVCAVLLKEMQMLDDIQFVHPKDVQDGKVELTNRDITTNLPYVESVHLCFDHHASERVRVQQNPSNWVLDADAPSASRVVYRYFGGANQLPNISEEMLEAVDKSDSAQHTIEDVVNPQGWELLSFLMDPRTGLGRFRSFRISNYQLMMNLIDYCANHTIDEILALPDVKERVDLYVEHQTLAKEQLTRCATQDRNLVTLDLRGEEVIYACNRFLIYALFPQANISMHVLWGRQKQNTVFAVGKSIFDRTSRTHVGELMLKFGGGGHKAAGTCQIDNQAAEQVLQALAQQITGDG